MEDDVEQLLIRFIGDNRDFTAVLSASLEATRTAVQAIQKEAEKIAKTSADASARAMARTGEAAKEEARKAKIMAEGAKVTDKNLTATEKYNKEMNKLRGLLDEGAISHETYWRASDKAFNANFNNTKAALEGQRVMKSVMTDQEKYERSVARLGNLLSEGAIDRETYDRAAAKANVAKNRVMAEGRAVTESLMTADEKRKTAVSHLNGLLANGAITQETHNRGIKEANKLYKEATPNLDRLANSMNLYTTALLTGIAVTTLWESAKRAIATAARSETMKTTYGTLLKSDERGEAMVKEIQHLAQSTALTNEVLQYGTKTLLQFGVAGSQVLPIMKQIGDIAGGDTERIKHLALAFGQMNQAGRLMGQDLIQMVNAGFNPLKEIARTSGKGGRDKNDILNELRTANPKMVTALLNELTKSSKKTVGELRADMEEGLITVEMVTQALKTSTEEGGSFYKMLEKNSKTLEGMWNNMKDDVTSALREIGEHMITELDLKNVVANMSQGLKDLTKWITNLTPQIKTAIKYIAITVGTLTALIIVIGLSVTAWMTKVFVMGIVKEAMVGLTLQATLLSAAMMALRLTLFGLAVYGAYLFYDMASGAARTREEMDKTRRIIDEMSKNAQAFTDRLIGWASAGHDVEERLKRVNVLLQQMKNEKFDVPGSGADRDVWSEQLKNKLGIERQTELVKQLQIRMNYLEKTGTDGVRNLQAEYDKIFKGKKFIGTGDILGLYANDNMYATRDVIEFERRQLEIAKSNLSVLKQRNDKLKEMKEQLEDELHPAGQLAMALKDIKKELRDDINFSGLDKWEKQIAELNILMDKLNTDKAVRKSVLEEVNVLQAIAKRRHYEGEMVEYLKKMEENWLSLGKSAEQAKYDYFVRKGANPAQLKTLSDASKQLALAKEQTRLEEEGKKLKDQFKTPTEVYRRQIEDLKEMLRWRYIDQDTFNKGMNQAIQKFNETTGAANKLKDALEGIKASAFGSADAIGKMNAFKEGLKFTAPVPLGDIQYKWSDRMPEWLKRYEKPIPRLPAPEAPPVKLPNFWNQFGIQASAPVGRAEPVDKNIPMVDQDRKEMLRLLNRIADSNESMEKKPPVVFKTANL